MCSVNDEDLDDSVQCMEKKPQLPSIDDQCKKCNEKKAKVVLRVKDAYCNDCFLQAATHKFRAAIGKSKLVRPRDHVLIAFSGSQASATLLHLVQAGLNEANHKQGAILNLSSSYRKDLCHDVAQQVKNSRIPLYITTLENSLDDSPNYFAYENYTQHISQEKEEQLKNLFDSVKSVTSKEDLLQKLRNKLLLKVAKHLKCTKIFTAETTSNLAVKLLSNVSLGRGAQLPLDVGFCDNRDPDIMMLRPMRDFTSKEVVFYNIFNELESVNIPSLGTKSDAHSSIQKLTEKFVTDLQEDFPSTVSTIFRTGEKLSIATSDAQDCCALCQAPLDTTSSESSAIEATEFSRMVSALGATGFDTKLMESLNKSDPLQKTLSACEVRNNISDGNNACKTTYSDKTSCGATNSCGCKGNTAILTHSQAETCLCYSCRLITREMVTLDALPSELTSSIKHRLRFAEMKKEIEDFLL
ncbi:Cytoplasmic tRNA 2-thiolation protein 2-A [Blattella germanica]|nr:Cytoplasmic tRNA 2-thiolation protein 2-A [Blattella germanica]